MTTVKTEVQLAVDEKSSDGTRGGYGPDNNAVRKTGPGRRAA